MKTSSHFKRMLTSHNLASSPYFEKNSSRIFEPTGGLILIDFYAQEPCRHHAFGSMYCASEETLAPFLDVEHVATQDAPAEADLPVPPRYSEQVVLPYQRLNGCQGVKKAASVSAYRRLEATALTKHVLFASRSNQLCVSCQRPESISNTGTLIQH